MLKMSFESLIINIYIAFLVGNVLRLNETFPPNFLEDSLVESVADGISDDFLFEKEI